MAGYGFAGVAPMGRIRANGRRVIREPLPQSFDRTGKKRGNLHAHGDLVPFGAVI
jgi:hypothetical protein